MLNVDVDTASESELSEFVIHMAIPRLGLAAAAKVKEAAEERQQQIQEDARAKLLENFRKQAAELGISLESLFPGMGGRKRATGTIPVKYRDPGNPNNIWSGRGMMAAWLRERHEKGEDIERYRVSEPEAAA